MDTGNFSSGLQRLIFLYNAAIREERWQAAEEYVAAVWEHYNLRAAAMTAELQKFRSSQGELHEQLLLGVKKAKNGNGH
jgi:hypothetical protein